MSFTKLIPLNILAVAMKTETKVFAERNLIPNSIHINSFLYYTSYFELFQMLVIIIYFKIIRKNYIV
ncbi:hypothetical protein BpHYR1_041523 [Brachionus plicatilis]|uniref:Uncharacterized protein n=1 Tax=Brachionus plicatilis TaxID=10195 RepID=A0A3M7S480_BRAPC|nr:hypothetical protein BpHYR1_041523 [Brachionus plicatilis]